MTRLVFFQKIAIGFIAVFIAFNSLAENSIDNTGDNTGMIITEVDLPFADTRLALENAIIGQGLKIENVMELHALLERTAADFQAPESPYVNAQSFDFCSTALVHKMAALHPQNPSVCPLIIFFYSLKTAPEKSYIVYRLPYFLHDDGSLRASYHELLQSIVDETSAW